MNRKKIEETLERISRKLLTISKLKTFFQLVGKIVTYYFY